MTYSGVNSLIQNGYLGAQVAVYPWMRINVYGETARLEDENGYYLVMWEADGTIYYDFEAVVADEDTDLDTAVYLANKWGEHKFETDGENVRCLDTHEISTFFHFPSGSSALTPISNSLRIYE